MTIYFIIIFFLTDLCSSEPQTYDHLKLSLQTTITELNKAAFKMGIDGDTPTGLPKYSDLKSATSCQECVIQNGRWARGKCK